MKRIPLFTAFFSLVLLMASHAAEPPGANQGQFLTTLKEVQNQQAANAENQVKINAKLVTIAESVRIARVYSSRGGK